MSRFHHMIKIQGGSHDFQIRDHRRKFGFLNFLKFSRLPSDQIQFYSFRLSHSTLITSFYVTQYYVKFVQHSKTINRPESVSSLTFDLLFQRNGHQRANIWVRIDYFLLKACFIIPVFTVNYWLLQKATRGSMGNRQTF